MTEIAFGLFIILCAHEGFVAFKRIFYERKLRKKLDNKIITITEYLDQVDECWAKPKWILFPNKPLHNFSAYDAANLVINELSIISFKNIKPHEKLIPYPYFRLVIVLKTEVIDQSLDTKIVKITAEVIGQSHKTICKKNVICENYNGKAKLKYE